LPDGNGLDIIPLLRAVVGQPEIIIMTGYGDADGAEIAIKNGAWDYIQKPANLNELILLINRVVSYRKEKAGATHTPQLKIIDIIGHSPALKICLHQITQAAASDMDVLITGETGTGKELIAKAIHSNSRRSTKKFVVVDCSAMPENLVESLLFGHEKGAFTGADRAKDGLIKQADNGTLFLDEIGELPLSMQKAFLRVLQERRFRPVGSQTEISSDFRLIAATNRNIEEMTDNSLFRQDLLFRIRSLNIHVPPLRERREDIKDLVLHYLASLTDHYHSGTKGISPDFWETLNKYDWPGNVRELIQALENALAAAINEPVLYAKHLPQHIRIKITRDSLQQSNQANPLSFSLDDPTQPLMTLQDTRTTFLQKIEEHYLRQLMSQTHWNIEKACLTSGLSRSRLYFLLKTHHISKTT